jgi:uridine kinase
VSAVEQKKVTISMFDGEQKEYPYGISLKEISREYEDRFDHTIVAGIVDNNVRELGYAVKRNIQLDFVDLGSDEGMRIYTRSLSFVFIRAARELFPGSKVSIEHSISKGLYCEVDGMTPMTLETVTRLQERMEEIIDRDERFTRVSMLREEAVRLFQERNQKDKVRLYKRRSEEMVDLHSLGWLVENFYETMVPSTRYLHLFELRYYPPGMILRFPEKSNPQVLPPFVEHRKLFQIFRESEEWGEILGVEDVASMNELVEKGMGADMMRVQEALHEKKVAEIADQIYKEREHTRVILIAGPSSSGKTTFAQRLRIQLRVNGMKPVAISLDDYFLDREMTPLDEDGEYNFEALEAIDVGLFNRHLQALILGEEVEIPTFNFITGKREFNGHFLRIRDDQSLIIEGIHGLNEELTRSIPRRQKFKIYISALTQLNLDSYNRIPTTDTRLIRRMVRDFQFRGHDALQTIGRWPSVRRGEEKYIFPFQEDADAMFNSALVYELGVLKPHAESLLQTVSKMAPEYLEATRLLRFLDHFISFDCDEIPLNSIIMEFIGGSCFL